MTETREQSVYGFEGFRLDPAQRRLTAPGGAPIALRPRVLDTLIYLVTHAGRPVAKDELLAAIWPGMIVEENNLNQAISALRQALGDDRQNPRFIATITGRGYQFVAPVDARAPAGPGLEAAASDVPPAATRRWRWPAVVVIAALLATVFLLVRLYGPVAKGPVQLGTADLVTTFPGSHSSPTLSPDATLMAFVSDRSGISQIWVMGLPDSEPVQITHGDLPAAAPSWSPVDDRILFQRADADGRQSIWVTNALGSKPPRLVVRDGVRPRFAGDGRRFIFARGLNEIHMASLDTNETRQLEGVPVTNGFAAPMPAMNTDGDVAFVLADEGPSGNVWVYQASNGEFRQLTRSDGHFSGVWAQSPAWTPDGRSLIYAAVDGDFGNLHLWEVAVASSEPRKLSSGAGGYGEPALSRDGSRLLYSYSRPVWRIMRTDPATGQSRALYESRTHIALPLVGPAGERVVYFGEHVWVLPLDGSTPRQVTFGQPGQATLPTWSRSDGSVYYYLERSLHRLDPVSGDSELVLDDFHWSGQNWLAVHGDRLAYHQRSLIPAARKTIIHELRSGEQLTLAERVLPADWNRLGELLLARRVKDSAIVICTAPGFECQPIMHAGGIVDGARPRWSADESRVYFRRARQDKPGYAEIWSVAATGGGLRREVEIGPYEIQGMSFGLDAEDNIIWNQYDIRGISEIWRSELVASD